MLRIFTLFEGVGREIAVKFEALKVGEGRGGLVLR
jgi:hypothetical protein